MGSKNLSKTAEKSSSSPRAADSPNRMEIQPNVMFTSDGLITEGSHRRLSAVDVASLHRRRLSSVSAVPRSPHVDNFDRDILRSVQYVLLGLQHFRTLRSNCGFDGFHRRR
jgi:hypothetical protein